MHINPNPFTKKIFLMKNIQILDFLHTFIHASYYLKKKSAMDSAWWLYWFQDGGQVLQLSRLSYFLLSVGFVQSLSLRGKLWLRRFVNILKT